jgi:hypothetical protein
MLSEVWVLDANTLFRHAKVFPEYLQVELGGTLFQARLHEVLLGYVKPRS